MLGTISFEVNVTKHGAWASNVCNPLKLNWHFDKVVLHVEILKALSSSSLSFLSLLFDHWLQFFYVILLCSPTSQKLTIQLRLDLNID